MLCKVCVGTIVSVHVCIYIYMYIAWKSEITSNHQVQNICEDSLIEEIKSLTVYELIFSLFG